MRQDKKDWQLTQLGELISIKHGWPFRSQHFSDYQLGRPIVVNIGNFQYTGGFRFESTAIKAYIGKYPKDYILKAGDILLVMTCQTAGGEILGIPGRIPNDGRLYLHNQRMGKVVVLDRKRVDQNFLYWLFLTFDFNHHLVATASGAKILHTAPSRIESYQFQLPPLPPQQKIAAILSAYDDLIENNTRRIAILEEMAQSLYREWFVHFRFPSHEKKSMVESALGMIPEGWAVKPFSEVADFINGFAFEPRHWGKVGKPIIKIAELKNGVTGKTPFYNGDDIPEKYHIRNGYLLFSWSADLDAYIWSGGSAFLNQHLFNVVPQSGFTKFFLFYALKDCMWEFRNRSQGTTMRHIKRSALDEVKFAVPPIDVQNAFVECVEPMILEVINLVEKNANLRQTRDLLLPKLISGEVDVEGLEIAGVEETGEVETKAVEV